MRTLLFPTLFYCCLIANAQKLPDYVPADGLVAWYPLSGEAKMRDMSGHGNHGTLKGKGAASYTAAEDRFGDPHGAIDLSNYDDKIVLPFASPPFSSAFSVTGWYQIHARDLGVAQPIFSIGSDYKHNVVDLSFGPGYYECSAALTGDSTVRLTSPPQPLLMFGWHFLAVTFDGSALRLYADGAEVSGRMIAPAFAKTFAAKLRVNQPVEITQRYSGEVDDVFLYNRALQPAEVNALFAGGSPSGSFMLNSGFDFGFLRYDDFLTVYPQLSSKAKPKAAEAINKALQLADFREIRAQKNPNGVKIAKDNTYWRYNIEMPTDRLIIITTIHTIINLERRDAPDVDRYYRYYFDAHTGDRLYLRDFFTQPGNIKMKMEVEKELFDSMTDRYGSVDQNCANYVRSSWESDRVRMRLNPYSRKFHFEETDCEGEEPDGSDHGMFKAVLDWGTVAPNFSSSGKYYFDNGPLPAVNTVSHTWTCLLGTNLRVTLALREAADKSVSGVEVYDYYGTPIPVRGKFQNGVLTLDELDAKGIAVATYEAKLDGRRLSGTWTKADKSRTLPFTAAIAGE